MAKAFSKKFYNSDAWKFMRKKILNRDCFNCAYCSARAEEVHHIIELTPQNINDVNVSLNPDNLISLCGDCHKKITKGSVDCDNDYYFDDNGQIVKYIPPYSQKN